MTRKKQQFTWIAIRPKTSLFLPAKGRPFVLCGLAVPGVCEECCMCNAIRSSNLMTSSFLCNAGSPGGFVISEFSFSYAGSALVTDKSA